MDIFSIIILISKWITLTAVSFCLYLVWIFVVNPWNQQRKYRKYKNVYVPERLNAPSGDLIEMEEKVANGKFRFQYLTDFDPTKYDIRLGHLGPHTHFQLISHRAHEEVNKLIPAVVDRHTAKFGVQFGPLIKDTLGLKRSTKMFKNKRQVFLKILGFNYSSKYISTMINVVKEKIATWQEGQEVNALLEMGNVALRIIVQITFGKDADSKMPELSYTNPDGSTSLMNFYEFFPKLMADLLKAEFYPLNVVFPFLFLNGWLYPNNINKKNMLELRSKMSSFMDTIEDKDSVYKQLVDNHKFKKEDIFDDIIGLVHAAHQTSHHTVCTVLFNIKKHPQWLEKIQKELEDAGLTTGCDIEAKLTRDVIHESANLA